MGRVTTAQADESAEIALSLRSENMSVREIAEYLGVSVRLVQRWLARGRKLAKARIKNIDSDWHLSKSLSSLEKIELQALEKYLKVDPDTAVAVGYLNTAMKARTEIKKLLQECGAMLKVPEVVEEGIPFDDPEIRKEYLLLRAKALARKRGKEAGGEG